MSVTIACIGSGNMGAALMKGATQYGGVAIGFTDTDRPKAEALARSLGASVYASNVEAVKKADYVFLAVKPQVLPGVLAEIAPAVRDQLAAGKSAVLVSMAVGWSIGKILAILGGAGTDIPADHAPVASIPVVRIMPNTPALISKGIIAMAVSREVPAAKAAELEKILSAAGIVDYLEEGYMDAVTGLSGSGPAFVYMFIEALADGGVLAGLPRKKALRYAVQTVLGAAAMVQETGRHPGELKDMVTSPGGTTIKGVAALENAGFRGAVTAAVEAAYRRSTELASPIMGETV
ncbi:MAG: pyrroline-5-carboxylate reductase [Treponema sp.]|jgi:pyrroline-5-carboxylate reductase|nr:pyrroline-5-carboxylate reductase [Treponema sp.]